MQHTPVHTVLLRDGVHAEVTFTTVDGWPVTVEALCDTGASSSSIDSRLADFIGVEYTGTVVNVGMRTVRRNERFALQHSNVKQESSKVDSPSATRPTLATL